MMAVKMLFMQVR